MKKLHRRQLLILLGILFVLETGFSQPREQVFTGARPMGMGETFVAIADDGNAVYWNPAGLPRLRRMEFNSMYGNLYGIGLANGFLSVTMPVNKRLCLGASYFHLGFGDDELSFFRDMVNVGGGIRYKNLYVGTTLKYLWTDTRLAHLSYGEADAFGLDLGGLFIMPINKLSWLKEIRLGLMIHDVGGTKIKFDDAANAETIYHSNPRWGIGFVLPEKIQAKGKYFNWLKLKNAKVAFDFDDRIHVGAETWLLDQLALRGGVQKDFYTKEEMTFSLGGSLKWGAFRVDYAYIIPPILEPSHLFSIAFGLSPSPITIEAIEMETVYASFYNIYATEPIGTVKIRSHFDRELTLYHHFEIPNLNFQSEVKTSQIGADARYEIELRAHFPESILSIVEQPVFPLIKMIVEYEMDNQRKSEQKTEIFMLHNRGAVSWETPAEAMAFIMPFNKTIEIFTSESIKDIPYRSDIELSRIYQAAALFDALGAIGIYYGTDTRSPFTDNIKYPVELLHQKRGDCDDLTVLYASLLENANIETAFVSTHNHITLMFNTGIHHRNWGVFPVRDSLAIIRRNTIWIPVEVNEIGNPFREAWEAGAENFRRWHPDEYEITWVRNPEARKYLSSTPDNLRNVKPIFPTEKTLNEMLHQDTLYIYKNRCSDVLHWYAEQLQHDPTNRTLRNRLGIIFAQQDSLAQAEKHFQIILNQLHHDPFALINLANVYCISGKYDLAAEYYQVAQNKVLSEPGLLLNLAILNQLRACQWESTDTVKYHQYQTRSEQLLQQAFEQLEMVYGTNYVESKALELLGIFEEPDVHKAGVGSWIKEKASALKKFIKENARKYLFNKPIKGAKTKPKAIKEGIVETCRFVLWWAYDEEAR